MRLPWHEFTRKDFRGVCDIQASCQIWYIVQRLWEIGCLIHDQRNAGRLVRCRIRREGEIFNAFYDKDLVCVVRHVIFVCCHGQCIMLHANGLRPYHYQRMQQLLPEGAQRKEPFFVWMRRLLFVNVHYRS